MKGNKYKKIQFFSILLIAALISIADGRTEGTRHKDPCKWKPLSSKCLKTKVEKTVYTLDTLAYFFGSKKRKKEKEKGISNKPSVSSTTISPDKLYNKSLTPNTTHIHDPVSLFKRAEKNMHNLENDACGVGLEPRILGGENTMPGEHPWLARLQYKEKFTGKKSFRCGGSLITPDYVLTAAHCLTNYANKLQSVRLGEYNTKMKYMDCSSNFKMPNDYMEMDTCEPARDYEIKSFRHHESYTRDDLAHDIGLIQLKKSVVYTRYIKPICLPVGRYKPKIHAGSDLMSAGWGMTEKSEGTEIPLKARTQLMERSACRSLIGGDLKPGQLCVGGADGGSTCHGDSGGPLVLTSLFSDGEDSNFIDDSYNRTILVGIISGGKRVCSIEPTLFSNVEHYLWWILTNIKT